jgi:hypothetical protein
MIPQLKSIFNQNQLTSLINLLTQTVNTLIAGKEDISNKQNSLATDGTNTKYPTVTAVNTGLATKLNLTGGTMSGPIAMGTSKITGLGTPTANQDAATKLYVDTTSASAAASAAATAETNANEYTLNAVAAKQNLFDYSLSVSGVTAVTMDGVQGGTATFTQVVAKKSSQYFRINSDQISATSKIIVTLVYDGNGYPIIASQKLATNRVDILVVNPDILTTGGTNTDASISIQYQIVG